MPLSPEPAAPEWIKVLGGLGSVFATSAIGRLMWHARLVQKGERAFLSIDLLWELPTAIGMAVIGKGLADWLDLNEWQTLGLVATLSYLGPRGLDSALAVWLTRRGGPAGWN